MTEINTIIKNSTNKDGRIININHSRDENLKDFLIIETKYTQSITKIYALRKKENGEWEGSEIKYNVIGKFNIISKLLNTDIEELKNLGILEYYELVIKNEKKQKQEEAKKSIFELYANIYKFDPINNILPNENITNEIKNALNNLTKEEQEEVAIDFYDHTISDNIINNNNTYKNTDAYKDIYKIYFLFKNYPFGIKFGNLINL